MRAVRTIDAAFRVVEVDEPGGDGVLVEVASAGICGSDLHYFHNGGFGEVRLKEPMILGHEVSGHIAALGEGVTGLREGQLVAISPSRPCTEIVDVSHFVAVSFFAPKGLLCRRLQKSVFVTSFLS